MKLKYHRELTVDRWGEFPFFKQVLMIATEMNRAGKWVKAKDFSEVKRCYERALELLYLTVETLEGARRLGELMRFKEMLCMLYAKSRPGYLENEKLMKALILMDRNSFLALNGGKDNRLY
jgi:hypothetical protein